MSELQPRQDQSIRSTSCDCGVEPGQPCQPYCDHRWDFGIPTFINVPDLPTGRGHLSDLNVEAAGFAWIDRLTITGQAGREGWHPVPAWGREGWDLGEWPYLIVAHYDHPDHLVYAIATYCEGDLDAKAFTTRAERDAETDRTAADAWHVGVRGPADLPTPGQPLAPPHCGPAHLTRLLEETA